MDQGADVSLPAGSGLEVELRAVSVEACGRIVGAVNAKLEGTDEQRLTAALLDLWIWGEYTSPPKPLIG